MHTHAHAACLRQHALYGCIIRSVHNQFFITTGIPSVGQSVTATVASSITVFILSSTLFFFIGCICGCFIHKYRIKRSDKNVRSQPAPLYEDLQPSLAEDKEKTFKLKENVAYGPIRSV